ncbi:hypothetical protein M514_09915 [Trichuris suis]|uniref:Uncharacterized protein n=1 Tax=Trichuris suis TaxID=68888 RepID=A0A085LW47_9BILA|nr:hypothetical protein M513_09915 [Trichuris suis]KFD64328.1 hypothetical protein M514_09915 [Trichuris suis]
MVTSKVGKQVNAFFCTKDLGEVAHYLGIEVNREEDGSFLLSQKGKIAELCAAVKCPGGQMCRRSNGGRSVGRQSSGRGSNGGGQKTVFVLRSLREQGVTAATQAMLSFLVTCA